MEANQSRKRKIGTHNGTFHCDEALACFMLKKTKTFADAEIVRTRESSQLDQMDVIVDVGGVYDPEKLRFDHHQIGFTGTFDEKHSTKLSSAGLIYKHFGKEIIKSELGTDDEQTNVVFQSVYDHFVEAIDAIDNGVDRYPNDIVPKYKMHTDLSARVGGLNPWWNDTTTQPDDKFKEAIEMAGKEFIDSVRYTGLAWLPAREIVERAVKSRFEVDPSGEIIMLERFCPWKEHLFTLEKELDVKTPIKYCIFGDNAGGRVQCVPESEYSFRNRKSLPWKGLRDEELSKASGIPDCVFVHISGFIGGNKTKEGALAMARKALQEP